MITITEAEFLADPKRYAEIARTSESVRVTAGARRWTLVHTTNEQEPGAEDLARDGIDKVRDAIRAELPENLQHIVDEARVVFAAVEALTGWLSGLVEAGQVVVRAPSVEVVVHDGAKPR